MGLRTFFELLLNMMLMTMFYLNMIHGGILMMGLITKADIYLDMLHQVPRVREAKRAVAALQVWGRRLVRADMP